MCLLDTQQLQAADSKQGLEQDTDPDNNSCGHINSRCSYYTDDQYNDLNVESDHRISIIHFNSRSLYTNYTSIRNYSKPFDIIAPSETWLCLQKGFDFELKGYESNYMNRKGERGGGVALYIENSLNYKVVENMTISIDDSMECITVEICMEKPKNLICSCLYRVPDSSTERFIYLHLFVVITILIY